MSDSKFQAFREGSKWWVGLTMLIAHHVWSLRSLSFVWRWHYDILSFSRGFLVKALVSWGGIQVLQALMLTHFGNSGLSKLKCYLLFFYFSCTAGCLKASCVLWVPKEGLNCKSCLKLVDHQLCFLLCCLLTVSFHGIALRKFELRDSQHAPFRQAAHSPLPSSCGSSWASFAPWSYGKQIWGEVSLLHKPTRHELVPKARKWARYLLTCTPPPPPCSIMPTVLE